MDCWPQIARHCYPTVALSGNALILLTFSFLCIAEENLVCHNSPGLLSQVHLNYVKFPRSQLDSISTSYKGKRNYATRKILYVFTYFRYGVSEEQGYLYLPCGCSQSSSFSSLCGCGSTRDKNRKDVRQRNAVRNVVAFSITIHHVSCKGTFARVSNITSVTDSLFLCSGVVRERQFQLNTSCVNVIGYEPLCESYWVEVYGRCKCFLLFGMIATVCFACLLLIRNYSDVCYTASYQGEHTSTRKLRIPRLLEVCGIFYIIFHFLS